MNLLHRPYIPPVWIAERFGGEVRHVDLAHGQPEARPLMAVKASSTDWSGAIRYVAIALCAFVALYFAGQLLLRGGL